MSRPNLRRFKSATTALLDKDGLFKFLQEEIGTMISEIDDAFKALTFKDNFAGKTIEIPIVISTTTTVANPLGLTPSGFLVLRGKVPGIIEGAVFNKDQVSFTSTLASGTVTILLLR